MIASLMIKAAPIHTQLCEFNWLIIYKVNMLVFVCIDLQNIVLLHESNFTTSSPSLVSPVKRIAGCWSVLCSSCLCSCSSVHDRDLEDQLDTHQSHSASTQQTPPKMANYQTLNKASWIALPDNLYIHTHQTEAVIHSLSIWLEQSLQRKPLLNAHTNTKVL